MIPYFRQLLGLYLTYHFLSLAPWAEELFGKEMPYDPMLSPTHDIFPNVLNLGLDPQIFLVLLSIISLMFTFNINSKLCSLILWYGWAEREW